MYIVHNLTGTTVILSDLRVEIGPRKILDLEYVAHRDVIDRSHDLRQAITSNKLRLVKHSVVKTHQNPQPSTVSQTIVNNNFDEQKMREIIKDVVSSEMKDKGPQPKIDVESVLKNIVESGVRNLQESIRDQINNIGTNKSITEEESLIDPDKLAELHQRSINKMTESIQTGGSMEGKKINIINANVKDLANEL